MLGIVVAILTAYIISKIDGSKAEHALLIELPEYKAAERTDNRGICVGESERLSDEGGNGYFPRIDHHVGAPEFWPDRICDRYCGEFWFYYRKSYRAVLPSPWIGYWQIVVALISGIAQKK